MNAGKTGLALWLLLAGVLADGAWGAYPNWVFPGATWQTQTPETVGVKTSQLAAFQARLGGRGVVIKDGYLIYSWGDSAGIYDWYSASKPVMSTMLFQAIEEHLVDSVDDTVSDAGWAFIPKDQPMKWRHLGDMTSGYGLPENPGTTYSYNDFAISLYGKSLDRIFPGEDDHAGLYDEGKARLMIPLGFQDGWLFDTYTNTRPGLRVKASSRDFARIGWMWLNKGRWGASQFIPQSYFDNYCKADIPSTTPRSSTYDATDYLGVTSYGGGVNQTDQGPGIYGFNWWHNTSYEGTGSLTWPSAPADTFQANGRWGVDVMTMFPSLGMVVAADCKNSAGSWGDFTRGDPASGMNGSLEILVSSIMHAGDANGDGAVNVGDLGILAGSWGLGGKFWIHGDFSHDGLVNVGDLGILAGNWGWTAPPGAPVPEPGGLALLGLAGLRLFCRRRRWGRTTAR